MYNRKIYLDMDGVICDFSKKFTDEIGEDLSSYTKKYGWPKTWKTIEEYGVKFWSDMEWMKGSKKLWNYLKNLDNVEILTGSPLYKVGEYAKKGKELWIKNNIGNLKVNHIEGKLKYKYVKNNDILIDDSKRNCDLWNEAGGISILHKNVEETIEKLNELLKNNNKNMNNIKTFEEFSFFKRRKELTPDEEYQKQKKEAQKDRKRIKNMGLDQTVTPRSATSKNYSVSSKNDPYGEEVWDEKEDIRRQTQANRRACKV